MQWQEVGLSLDSRFRIEVASPINTDARSVVRLSGFRRFGRAASLSPNRLCGGLSMPLLTQRVPDEDEQYCLVASLDNVRNLSTVLKAIHFKDHAACFATKNGLKVTVENAKCVQANAFIQVWESGGPL